MSRKIWFRKINSHLLNACCEPSLSIVRSLTMQCRVVLLNDVGNVYKPCLDVESPRIDPGGHLPWMWIILMPNQTSKDPYSWHMYACRWLPDRQWRGHCLLNKLVSGSWVSWRISCRRKYSSTPRLQYAHGCVHCTLPCHWIFCRNNYRNMVFHRYEYACAASAWTSVHCTNSLGQ